MQLYHNSHSDIYRRPFGAAVVGFNVFLSIRADETVEKMFLRTWKRDEGEHLYEMNKERRGDGIFFNTEISMPEDPGLLWYFFVATDQNGNTVCYGNKEDCAGGEGRIWEEGQEPQSYQITVYKEDKSPEWFKKGLVYQIFPDRFFRGKDYDRRRADSSRGEKNGIKRIYHDSWQDTPFYTRNEKGEVTRWGFFGGTLEGIREKLGYLKSLGVTVIYLNPIFEASSNHRYDTGDYMKIDAALGDEESFRNLCDAAREADMHIILDGVFSHTGADSRYFDKYGNYGGTGAYQSENSPYYEWYSFRNGNKDDYECWWGVTDLPNVNEMCKSFKEHICGQDGVIRKWLRAGASGWRLDVADELPDEFIKEIRRAIKAETKDGLLMGEVWEDASNKVAYDIQREYFWGDELQSTMHYPFRDNAIAFLLGQDTAGAYVRKMMSICENYPKERLDSALNLIGSHDRVRILSVLGEAPQGLNEIEKEYFKLDPHHHYIAIRRLKLISLLQFLSPGVPCIYYGDEAGLQGHDDPYNRGTFPWGNEDQEIMAHYRMLALIKKQYPHLTEGGYSIEAPDDDILVIRREMEGSELLLIINRKLYDNQKVSIETKYSRALELITSKPVKPEKGSLNIDMEPVSAALFYCSNKEEYKGLTRSAGVLCHVTSLPGQLPESAYRFIDFLKDAGQKLWQILPLNPTGLADSPYMSPCAFAGNTDMLPENAAHSDRKTFEAFCDSNAFWLDDYALFTVLKKEYKGAPWVKWPDEIRRRENLEELRNKYKDEIEVCRHKQCDFFMMWESIKEYAAKQGISIIGDAPLYVAPDSSDVWANQKLFFLDDHGNPAMTAGVPPDYYAEEGQNWGSPLYNWENMKAEGYSWWINRLRWLGHCFDYVRLDHFRGFSAYYAIPQGKTGKEGLWMPGPGKDFFDKIAKEHDMPKLVAEDMGLLDSDVHNLRRFAKIPGMQVWQFSYEDMENMTQEEADQRIFYSGTHDNQTILGWCNDKYGDNEGKAMAEDTLKRLYASKGAWVIVQLQDVFGLSDEARMNTPGTMAGNWKWKASESDDWAGAKKMLYTLTSCNKR